MMSTRNLVPRLASIAFAGTLALTTGACGDDSAADEGETHAEHGDHGDHGDHTGGMESDPESMVDWATAPPVTVTVGQLFAGEFMVTTMGELHVTELRICEGHDVADCGLGDMTSFDMSFPAPMHDGHYHGEASIDAAGQYTVVAYAHIGENPHTSVGHNLTVE